MPGDCLPCCSGPPLAYTSIVDAGPAQVPSCMRRYYPFGHSNTTAAHIAAIRAHRVLQGDHNVGRRGASVERAGIRKRVYPHLIRHSLATNLMHSGTGILAIKQQMGHVHLGTTMRYLHGDPERLKQEFFVHLPKYLPD